MAKDDKSFKELLSEAPLAAKAGTVNVIGTLARAAEADKFELTLADGSSVTLETDAVRSFTRLGGAVGQVLVQMELDVDRLPKDLDPLKRYLVRKQPPFDVPFHTNWSDLVNTFIEHHNTGLAGGLGQLAPFVAAAPPQALPVTVDPVDQRMLYNYPGIYKQPYQDQTLVPYYPFAVDHPHQKPHTDPQER